ncbi:hypothetical protein GCM10023155_17650 [Bremerella cremea]
MSSNQLQLLRNLLLAPDSYCFAQKRCIPCPTVSFRLENGTAHLDVSLGFSCTGWIVQSPYERRGSFFDPVREDMLALVKQLFIKFASRDKRSV